MIFKTLDIKQQRSCYICPSLLSKESFQTTAQKNGTRNSIPELRNKNWDFTEIKLTRIHKTEKQRGESLRERQWGKMHCSALQRLPLDCQLNTDQHTQGRGENCSKRLEGKTTGAHTGRGIVPTSISQSEKLNSSQSINSVFRRLLPQQ